MKKFALIGLIALVIGGLGTAFYWKDIGAFEKGDRVRQTFEVEAQSIEQIIVDSDVAHVRFFTTTSDLFEVMVDAVSSVAIEDFLTIDERDQTLSISIERKSSFFRWSFISIPSFDHEVSLEIGIPASFTGSIETSIDVGSIRMSDLTLDQFVGEVNVGSIVAENMTLNKGTAQVDVGEIKLALTEWSGQITAHTDIGNITIELPEKPEDYSLHLESDIGSIKGAESGHTNVGNQEGPRLRATSNIGNINIHWN